MWVLHMKRSTVAGFTNEYLIISDTGFCDCSKVSYAISSLYGNILIASALVVSVRFTSKTGQYMVFRPWDHMLTVASDALSRGTRVKDIRIAIIPLSMQVIGHVDDVINIF